MRTLGRILAGLAFSVCFVVLAACGGSTADLANVDVDKPLAAQGWEITLTAAPEKTSVVGEGGFTSQATGSYLVVLLRAVNQEADIRLFPAKLLTVQDGAGNVYKPTGSTVQFNLARTLAGHEAAARFAHEGQRDARYPYDLRYSFRCHGLNLAHGRRRRGAAAGLLARVAA